MKQLYIHIGTGKTGTTALQDFLDLNELQLRKNNIKYVDTFKSESVHHQLCTNFNRTFGEDIAGVEEGLNLLIDEAKSSQCNKFIISSEYFPDVTEEEIEKIYIKKLSHYFDIHIIVYLRRQDEYLESWYAQLIKTDMYDINIFSLKNLLSNSGLFNYFLMLEKWSKHIGRKNTHVKVYEKSQFFNNNIFNDFMTIFNLFDIEKFELPTKNRNPSLTVDQILLINAFYNSNSIEFMDDVIKKPFSFDIGSSKKILSPEERTKLVLEWNESNQKVAKFYLGRDDGKLFYSPLPTEIEKDWEMKKYPSTEYLIRAFTHLISKQKIYFEKQIDLLKEEIKELRK